MSSHFFYIQKKKRKQKKKLYTRAKGAKFENVYTKKWL